METEAPITIKCLLCDHVVEVPLLPAKPDTSLAGVFGFYLADQAAINARNARVEEALQGHYKSHTLQEWVKKVMGLQEKSK